jgi:preprotein translocase subunit SecF
LTISRAYANILIKLMKKIFARIWDISAKTWLYLFIVSAIVCVLALRHNNAHMVQLRNAVYGADQNNGDVNKALNNLREYVLSHMNTNLSSGNNNIKPPIQLKYTYQRLYDAQLAQVQASNQAVYSAAQVYCHNNAAQNSTPAQLACIQNYAVNHGVKDANINIPAGLYEFDFVSPSWSPDLAGWSLLLSIIFLLAFFLKLIWTRLRH